MSLDFLKTFDTIDNDLVYAQLYYYGFDPMSKGFSRMICLDEPIGELWETNTNFGRHK